VTQWLIWLQCNGAPNVPVSKHNRDSILIICKQHVIMLMMKTMTNIYPCNTQSADHNSNAPSRITVRNRRKPKSTDSISFHVITKPTKLFYYEARHFSGNSGYPLRFRTGLSGVKTEEYVIFFSLSSRLWVMCWGRGSTDETGIGKDGPRRYQVNRKV